VLGLEKRGIGGVAAVLELELLLLSLLPPPPCSNSRLVSPGLPSPRFTWSSLASSHLVSSRLVSPRLVSLRLLEVVGGGVGDVALTRAALVVGVVAVTWP
jgi:hypothetical protein